MRRLACSLPAALLALALPELAQATGYYGPDSYLDRGGQNVVASPEFYWDLELKRIAHGFPAPEKLRARENPAGDSATELTALANVTTAADSADFADALPKGSIRPTQPARAPEKPKSDPALMAETIKQTPTTLPEECTSDFAYTPTCRCT